jgi:hypothetical protein
MIWQEHERMKKSDLGMSDLSKNAPGNLGLFVEFRIVGSLWALLTFRAAFGWARPPVVYVFRGS